MIKDIAAAVMTTQYTRAAESLRWLFIKITGRKIQAAAAAVAARSVSLFLGRWKKKARATATATNTPILILIKQSAAGIAPRRTTPRRRQRRWVTICPAATTHTSRRID